MRTDKAINDIKTNPNNPRIIKDDKFANLVQSIKDFPEMLELRPIVVNKDMIILGGNMRYKACKEAGLKEIPVIVADNLTEEQEREFLIKDNVSGGEWDWDILANEWDKDELEEWGLDVQFETVEPTAEEDDFEVDEGIQTDIVLGDLFEIGPHRLLCGDSTNIDDVNKLMNGEKADMVLTDPPYNVDYEGKTKEKLKIKSDKMSNSDFIDFLSSVFACYFISMKEGAGIYVFGPLEDGVFLNTYLNSGLKLQSILIWLKNTIVMGRKDYHYKHEPILYGWKEGASHNWYGGHDKQTVIECNKPPRNGEHPTMKPIELMEKILKNSSKEGMKVLDLFGGSGSTMVACHQLNRKCYMSELDPKYVQTIINRMIKLDSTLEIKKNGQPYNPEISD